MALLERLLELDATGLDDALSQVVDLLARSLGADKVDAFLHHPGSGQLIAWGTSDTPMGRRQRALGLHVLPADDGAGGGRTAWVFRTGEPYLTGRADEDPVETPGIVRDLGVRSSMAVPLAVGEERRGVLLVCSAAPERFSPEDLAVLRAAARWTGVLAQRAAHAEQLARERAFLEALLESLDVGIVACDAEGVLTLFNRASRDLHGGLAPEPIPSDEWAERYDLYLPDGRTRMTPEQVPLLRALRGEHVRDQELVIAPEGHGPRVLLASGRPIRDGAGSTLGAVVAMHDVTARRRAEDALKELHATLERRVEARTAELEAANAALRESEERFRAVVETSPDLIAIHSEGRLEYINPAGAALLGADDPAAIVGRAPEELVQAEGLTRLGAEVAEMLRHGMFPAREAHFRRLDGTALDVEVAATKIAYRGRAGILAFARDISDRKRADDVWQRLSRETERQRTTLQAVMECMDEGLWLVDEHGRMRYANGRVGGLLGIDVRRFVGRPVSELLAEAGTIVEDDEAVGVARRDALARLEEKPTIAFTLKTSPPRDVSAQYFPVRDAGGRYLGYGAVLRDVTRERELSRLKDELVATVSHELRTPLSSLIGFSELLLTHEYDDAERREYLEIMLREGLRLSALVDDFLDLERLSSGRERIEAAPIDLRPVLEIAVGAAGADEAHPIRLTLPRNLPLVLADAERIQQVLANLLSNARKYSPDGGEITVSARVTGGRGRGARHTAVVEVAVRDRGMGLEPEVLPRLFERFYRTDGAQLRAIGGTGLGLAICRVIVEAHGGRIWAESAGPSRGSTFFFTIPVATFDAPAHQDGQRT